MRHRRCHCQKDQHEPKLIAVTGGPGAGKTATIDVVRRHLCDHLEVLPEAATVLYSGGFPRRATPAAKRGAQRAIFAVQRELERIALEEKKAAIVLCDRGTLDGLAYWPDDEASFFAAMGTTREEELRRYAMVIHLRTPTEDGGYTRTNPLRVESSLEARLLDEMSVVAWLGHPRRVEVPAMDDFIAKIDRAVELIRRECPSCCQVAQRLAA